MENLRAIALMVFAMAVFALADMFIKQISAGVPTGEILLILGLGGFAIFAVASIITGQRIWTRDFFLLPVVVRNLGEVVGSIGMITALSLTSISSISAIQQAGPLIMTLGAALFMKEQVGWRRWSAILVGLFGVLLIIRPGFSSFDPASLFAVVAVIGMSIRDLASRAAPVRVSSLLLATYGFVTLAVTGLALLIFSGGAVVPNGDEALRLGSVILFGALGYYALIASMRLGEVSAIAPFRYVRLIFGIAVGVLAFGEQPDFWMILGSIIIIASGLYSFARERRLAPSLR